MTEYRKLIRFGRSSTIISLPKEWIKNNELRPGDNVIIEVLPHNIIISPDYTTEEEEETKKTTISSEEPLTIITRSIIEAYINGANQIIIKGKSIPEKRNYLREVIHKLMALETIEESSKRIIAKSYLNMSDIRITNLTRKIDNIIRSMFIDFINITKEENSEYDMIKNVMQRDTDVNRISYLLFRAIKHFLENPRRMKENLSNTELLNKWITTQALEKIGDELKRAIRNIKHLNKEQMKTVSELIKEIYDHYTALMKALYKNDKEEVKKCIKEKRKIYDMIENLQNKQEKNHEYTKIIEHARSIFRWIQELTITATITEQE